MREGDEGESRSSSSNFVVRGGGGENPRGRLFFFSSSLLVSEQTRDLVLVGPWGKKEKRAVDKGWSRRGEDNEIIIQELFSQGSIIGKKV